MKIDPSQSTPLQSYPVSSTRSPLKAAATSPVSPATDEAQASKDLSKVKELVGRLMTQSAIRPEKVEGRTAEDPVTAFDEAALRKFVSALRDDV
jgi:hypothetical protein